MVAHTAADDALPLLAFALRELWDRHGAGGSLRLVRLGLAALLRLGADPVRWPAVSASA